MEIKVIRNTSEYQTMLQEAERLVALDPAKGSEDADRLELLSLIIEDYERRLFPFENPDPIEAIEFRMQEQGLRQADLVLFFGSRSRVSEVLARKRSLTVPMIRAVSKGLGIPLEILVAERKVTEEISAEASISWEKFPIKEMQKRGWITLPDKSSSVDEAAAKSLKEFLRGLNNNNLESALFRRSFRGDTLEEKAYYSTLAWTGRVISRARLAGEAYPPFDPSTIDERYFVELAQLSRQADGPLKAIDSLKKKGIAVIVEPKLPNALIDGAALMTEWGLPVIGLTLRYDRIDYFWFTLLHELAHVWKHLTDSRESYIDRVEGNSANHAVEREANRIARDALIPRSIWKRSGAYLRHSRQNILELAEKLNIHPAIVVGRIQKENEKYDIYRDLLGQDSIKLMFPNTSF